MICVVNKAWYRGPKRAIPRLRAVATIEQAWLDGVESLISSALSAELLAPAFDQAHKLLVSIAEAAVASNDEDAKAVRRGLSYWPDVAELHLPALGQ